MVLPERWLSEAGAAEFLRLDLVAPMFSPLELSASEAPRVGLVLLIRLLTEPGPRVARRVDLVVPVSLLVGLEVLAALSDGLTLPEYFRIEVVSAVCLPSTPV